MLTDIFYITYITSFLLIITVYMPRFENGFAKMTGL